MTYSVFYYSSADSTRALRPTHDGVFLTGEAATREMLKQQERFAKLTEIGAMSGETWTFVVLDAKTENEWAAAGVKFRTR